MFCVHYTTRVNVGCRLITSNICDKFGLIAFDVEMRMMVNNPKDARTATIDLLRVVIERVELAIEELNMHDINKQAVFRELDTVDSIIDMAGNRTRTNIFAPRLKPSQVCVRESDIIQSFSRHEKDVLGMRYSKAVLLAHSFSKWIKLDRADKTRIKLDEFRGTEIDDLAESAAYVWRYSTLGRLADIIIHIEESLGRRLLRGEDVSVFHTLEAQLLEHPEIAMRAMRALYVSDLSGDTLESLHFIHNLHCDSTLMMCSYCVDRDPVRYDYDHAIARCFGYDDQTMTGGTLAAKSFGTPIV